LRITALRRLAPRPVPRKIGSPSSEQRIEPERPLAKRPSSTGSRISPTKNRLRAPRAKRTNAQELNIYPAPTPN
jgi:hypothetical protein